MNTITFLEELGRGASGVVRKGLWSPHYLANGILVAIKTLSNVIPQQDFENEVWNALRYVALRVVIVVSS